MISDDDTLFAWARHYGSCIALLGVLGVMAGFLAVSLSPDRMAASTLVVQAGDSIKPRQLGPVAITVFRSQSVLTAAARELGRSDSSAVEKGTELVPLPDAPAFIVIGQARGYGEAAQLSEAVAGALVEALNRQVGTEEFRIFSGPESSSVPGDLSTGVSAGIGGAAGFWLGMSYAVLHYRWKRPVLTLRRALVLSGADQLAIHRGRGWSWLGYLRHRFPRRELARNEIRLAWLKSSPEILSSVTAGGPGGDVRVDGGSPTTPPNGADVLVITARPGTEEQAIATSRLMVGGSDADRAGRIGLVWVR